MRAAIDTVRHALESVWAAYNDSEGAILTADDAQRVKDGLAVLQRLPDPHDSLRGALTTIANEDINGYYGEIALGALDADDARRLAAVDTGSKGELSPSKTRAALEAIVEDYVNSEGTRMSEDAFIMALDALAAMNRQRLLLEQLSDDIFGTAGNL